MRCRDAGGLDNRGVILVLSRLLYRSWLAFDRSWLAFEHSRLVLQSIFSGRAAERVLAGTIVARIVSSVLFEMDRER